ncbi:hypothetical protein ACQPYK_49890 (plasmid) [Streptosporangium sp. CA-135522]|uniref:hypothetical protein n=1 Tax=Streptosporangium sp. CA-135522 TaxID=3240072 RepID=UPI003D8EB835
MDEKVRTLMAEVLDEGLDDWITLGHILYRASTMIGAETSNARSAALAAVKILLTENLAVAGNIGDSGFEAWDLNVEQALDRILLECESRNWVLGLTDVWIATTEKGDDLARSMKVEGEIVLDQLVDQ